MTDYTKLIERLHGMGSPTSKSAAEAIEALQAECAEHKENAIRNARIAVSIRAERDQLQSQLDALGKGEPVAWRFIDDKDNGHVSYSTTHPTDAQVAYLKIWKRPAWQPLYAAPKALAPLKDEPWMVKAIDEAYGIGGTP